MRDQSVTTTQGKPEHESCQTSASVVLLVVLLFAGQMSGVLYLSVAVEMILGLVFWIIALALV